MNERRVSKSGNGIAQFEPTPVASLISKFMRVARRTLIHERDRLESKLYNNGPPGGLLPTERQRLAAVCGALASGRIARHVAAGVICMVAALVAVGTNLGLHKAIGAQPGPADPEEGVQVLTRGPVHEAFAETVTFDPEPGIVVPKAPSFGLAASGAPCRPAANGCPGIGASPGRAFSGLPGTGPTPK